MRLRVGDDRLNPLARARLEELEGGDPRDGLGTANAAPDSFGYTLTVDTVGARSHSVAFDVASAPPSLEELVSAVRKSARRA